MVARLSRPCVCGVTVTAEPDVSSMPLRPDDEFVVIASDGIFDVFDNDQVRGLPLTRLATLPRADDNETAPIPRPSPSLTARLSLFCPRRWSRLCAAPARRRRQPRCSPNPLSPPAPSTT